MANGEYGELDTAVGAGAVHQPGDVVLTVVMLGVKRSAISLFDTPSPSSAVRDKPMGQEPDQPLNARWTLFVTDSWMLLASIGTFMIIVVVVVTSIRAARTRLRYASWHLIHLYAYLGMALALPLQIFDGTHSHDLWTQVYWWTLYFGTLAAVLLLPGGLPDPAVVATPAPGQRGEDGNTRPRVHLGAGRDLDKLRTKSGSSSIWRFLGGTGWTRGHPYTISAAPHPEKLRVTVQTVGGGSQRVTTVEPGTPVLIEGPYGTLTDDIRRHSRMVMIAAGGGHHPVHRDARRLRTRTGARRLL